jgi:transposase InsO family protein
LICATKPVAPNLLDRNFTTAAPNLCYVGDITYISTGEGWLYLATVIDLYSRKIVGWSMSNNMKAELVNNALLMAIFSRKPAKGLIWHTDRGSQYVADSHLKIIQQHGIIQSMSRKGNCWDNAVAESFFATLKNELVYQQKFNTREEAKHAIFEYIEVFYNRIRVHSVNDYLSPDDYEAVLKCA